MGADIDIAVVILMMTAWWRRREEVRCQQADGEMVQESAEGVEGEEEEVLGDEGEGGYLGVERWRWG